MEYNNTVYIEYKDGTVDTYDGNLSYSCPEYITIECDGGGIDLIRDHNHSLHFSKYDRISCYTDTDDILDFHIHFAYYEDCEKCIVLDKDFNEISDTEYICCDRLEYGYYQALTLSGDTVVCDKNGKELYVEKNRNRIVRYDFD